MKRRSVSGAPPPIGNRGLAGAKPVKTGWDGRAIFLALALVLLAVTPVAAHGGGKQQIAGEPSGPYHIYVWSSPDPWRVGDAHTTVAVTRLLESGEETPATGLEVFVTYQQGAQSERVPAVEQTGAQQGYYEADGAPATVGEWQAIVEVSGAEGAGAVRFVETVLPADEFNWWLIGGGALLALLLLGLLGMRRAGHKPAQRGAGL